jgi:hypothetical protein
VRAQPERLGEASVVSDLVHIWNRCHSCGKQPIIGGCFECEACPAGPDNSLCEECYDAFQDGRVKHPAPGSYAELTHVAADRRHTFRALAGRPRIEAARWLAVPGEALPPPRIGRFVVRPEVWSRQESFVGTYAFVIDGPPALLLTALHVMDTLIRAKGVDCSPTSPSYSGRELPAIVTRVNLFDVFAPNWALSQVGTARPMLVLPNARVGDEEPFAQRDIAAFMLEETNGLVPAKLARRLPRVGEPVWLVAKRERRDAAHTIEATVVEQTEGTFIFRYEAGGDIPRHASGAPLVNQAGEVIGINVGGGMFDGIRFGHANHVLCVRRHLQEWLPAD